MYFTLMHSKLKDGSVFRQLTKTTTLKNKVRISNSHKTETIVSRALVNASLQIWNKQDNVKQTGNLELKQLSLGSLLENYPLC